MSTLELVGYGVIVGPGYAFTVGVWERVFARRVWFHHDWYANEDYIQRPCEMRKGGACTCDGPITWAAFWPVVVAAYAVKLTAIAIVRPAGWLIGTAYSLGNRTPTPESEVTDRLGEVE